MSDKYTLTTTCEKGLIPEQLGELAGKQTVAADKVAENVDQLQNSGISLGMSHISDNGKIIIRLSNNLL